MKFRVQPIPKSLEPPAIDENFFWNKLALELMSTLITIWQMLRVGQHVGSLLIYGPFYGLLKKRQWSTFDARYLIPAKSFDD